MKAKQGNTVRTRKRRDKWTEYLLISAGMKFRNKNKFWYGIPAYTGPLRVLQTMKNVSKGI
jgi:hypothetical protein